MFYTCLCENRDVATKVMFMEYLAIPRCNKRNSTEGCFIMNVTSLGTGYCINSATLNYKIQRHARHTNYTPFDTNTLISVRILTLSFPSQVNLISARIYFKLWQCLSFLTYVPITHIEILLANITLILRRSRTGTVWFYTSTSNKRAARPKLYTKSLTRDLKLMYSYSRLTLVRISINL